MGKSFKTTLFLTVQICVLKATVFFLQFLVNILPLGSGSVDPHIFADPDPGSQNLADSTDPDTDPDPKHYNIGSPTKDETSI